MRVWRVIVEVTDTAKNSETGETFRHLGRNQIKNLFDKLDLPASITTSVKLVEEK